MTDTITNRWRAALLHLAIGVVVLAAALALVRFAWYPRYFFQVQDAARTLPVLAGACLLLGPLLTLVVFKPGKKSLRFDLGVIILLQVAALSFVVYRLHIERPSFMVFAVDRFNVLTKGDVDRQSLVDAGFPDERRGEPVLAVARMPTDPGAISRLTREVLLEGRPDLERRPEYWVPYADAYRDVVTVARSLSLLAEMRPEATEEIERRVAHSGLAITDLLFVPVMGKRDDYVVLIRKADGAVLDAIGLQQAP